MSHESRFGLKKLCVSVSLGLAVVASAFGAWYDTPVVKASVDLGYPGSYAYYINLSEDGRYLMVNTQSGDDSFPVQLYSTADLNGAVGAMPKCALGEAFGGNLFGTGGNGWKGGAISSTLGVMIPGSGAPTLGNAVYTVLDMPATRWTAGVSAFEVTGLGTASVDGMDFNPAGTVLYCNNKSPQNKILAYPVTSKSAFGTPTEFTVSAATRIRNLSVYSIGGKDLVYFGEGNVGSGTKAVYVLDPSTGTATALVTDATRFLSNIMNVKVSGAETSAPKLYVQTESSGLFVYTLAADGKSVVSTTPVRAIGHAGLVSLCGSSVTCNIASFEVSPDGRFAYLIGLSTTGFPSPALCVIANDDASGATTIAAKTLDGTETFEVTANTIVSALTVSADSTVTIAEGKTLTVNKFLGAGVLTKSGAGELALGPTCDGGKVVVAQAGLSVSGLGFPVALPSVASAAALHLDASDETTFVLADTSTAGMRKFNVWRDVRGTGYPTAGKCDTSFNGALLPCVNESLYLGRAVADFSNRTDWTGPALKFSQGISVREAFFVVNEATAGYPLINDSASTLDGGRWQRSAWAADALKNGLIECDDVSVAYATRLPAGFHVVHYKLTSALTATMIQNQADRYGGAQFGEMILFSSALSETDAQAVKTYLARKWQVAAKLDSLSVAPGAQVSVCGTKTLAVDTLATVDPLEVIAGAAPAELANAKIHLDASEPTTFTYSGDVTAAGYKRVNKWADVRGAGYPYAARTASLTMPYVNTAVLPGGVEILDFDAAGWGTATLSFSESIAVAEAFIVVKDAANDQSIINDTNGNGSWQHNQWASGYLTGGLTEVDGVATTYSAAYPTGLHVFHIKPTSALSVASMVRRDTWYGGMQIAEMILFTAAQSTDAATRINAYLKTKWTNTGVWGPARTLSATADVAAGSALNATAVAGAAKFGKTGSGTMAVRNPSKASAYAVAGGCLSFEGSGAPVAKPTVMSAAALDLDASAADSIVFADGTTDGMRKVVQWKDVRGGTYPTASKSDLNGAQNPYLNESLFPGRAVMDFTTTALWAGPAMKLSTTLSVREAFFIVCDNTKCMPYVNDDAVGSNGSWQRNGYAHANILNGTIKYDDIATTYATRLPEGFHLVHYKLTGNLSVTRIGSQCNTFGGMQFGEIVLFNGPLTDADANAVKNYLRRKWQRCDVASLSFGKGAEIAVADNKLVKVAAVEQPTNGKVTLGENAKLVLPAGVTVGDVSATGGAFGSDVTLANDFVLEVPDLAKPLTVAGALTLPAIGTIRIAGEIVPTGNLTDYVLANASSVSAAANPQWKVEASPARFIYRAYVENGKLMLRVKKPGLSILIR